MAKLTHSLFLLLVITTLFTPVLAQEAATTQDVTQQLTELIAPPLKLFFGVPESIHSDTIVILRLAIFLLLVLIISLLITKIPIFEGKQAAGLIAGGIIAYLSIRMLPDTTLLIIAMAGAALAVFAVLVMIAQSVFKAAPTVMGRATLFVYGAFMIVGAVALNSIGVGVNTLFGTSTAGWVTAYWLLICFIMGLVGALAAVVGLWKVVGGAVKGIGGGFTGKLHLFTGETKKAEADLNAEAHDINGANQLETASKQITRRLETDIRNAAFEIQQNNIPQAKKILADAVTRTKQLVTDNIVIRKRIAAAINFANRTIKDLQDKDLKTDRAEANLTKLTGALEAMDKRIEAMNNAVSRLELAEEQIIQTALTQLSIAGGNPAEAYALLNRAEVLVRNIGQEQWAEGTQISQELNALITESKRFAAEQHAQQSAEAWEAGEVTRAAAAMDFVVNALAGVKAPTAKNIINEVRAAEVELKRVSKLPARQRFGETKNAVLKLEAAKEILARYNEQSFIKKGAGAGGAGQVTKQVINEKLAEAIVELEKADQAESKLLTV